MRTIGYASKNIVKTTVKTITLDDYCSKNKILQIKFLKMDVEGNEFNIIKGAKSLLKKGKIDFIQFEFGHAARAGRIYLFDIIDLLAKYNYFTYVIKPKKIEKIIYSPFIENRYNMGNFVAFKNDKLPHISKIIG
jgi:hypothetical protein